MDLPVSVGSHHAVRLAILAAALCVPSSHAASGSDPGSCETLRTYNATGNRIWVTVYDAGKLRHLDYGWVDACTVRTWRSGNYTCGAFYHVRAEVKNYDLSQNVFDTNVQTNPQGENYSSWGVTLRRNGTSNNYYWEHGNTAGCTPTGQTHCCQNYIPPQGSPELNKPPAPPAPPPPPAQVSLTFTNTLKIPAKVTVYTTDNPKLHEECVAPEKAATWQLKGYWEYRVRAIPHRKSCDDSNALTGHVAATKPTGTAASMKLSYDAVKKVFVLAP